MRLENFMAILFINARNCISEIQKRSYLNSLVNNSFYENELMKLCL